MRTFEQQAANQGLRELLIGHQGGTELARRAQERISPAVADIVARAHQARKLKPSVGATDIAMIPVMINALMRAAHDVDPQLWRRWLAIIMDGICSGPRRSEVPGAPPTPNQVVHLIGGTSKTPPRPLTPSVTD